MEPEGFEGDVERYAELKSIAADLDRAALLVRVSARAIIGGSAKAAAETLLEALKIVVRYTDMAEAAIAFEHLFRGLADDAE